MIDKEKSLIEDLMRNAITKEEFQELFPLDLNQDFLLQGLKRVYDRQDSDELEYLMFIGFCFDLYSEKMANILCQLIIQEWHHMHEDLASLLQDLKNPESVESLYRTALTKYEYLNFDDSYALAVKCIWALSAINTENARKKLELLAQSDNPIIKENALKQLSRNN